VTSDDVRVALYRSFVEEGRAPHLRQLAARVGLGEEETRSRLRDLAADDVIAFFPGTEEVWLAHPFCAREAPFTVHGAGRRWDAICIWDALGVLALMECDGRVLTFCPDCGEPIELEVVHGLVESAPGSIVHFGVPARRWYEDVGFT
jgi:hypothetical protein